MQSQVSFSQHSSAEKHRRDQGHIGSEGASRGLLKRQLQVYDGDVAPHAHPRPGRRHVDFDHKPTLAWDAVHRQADTRGADDMPQETNKTLRQVFAKKMKLHQREGNFIVYFDETNFNVYCKRGRGRAKRGEHATVVLPPSKGANLQVQCAVNSAVGVVRHRLERGSIRMEQNLQFIEDIYDTVKASMFYRENYTGKIVVVVLDNAPAHRQTEERVAPHEDLEILRLAPYSPMCNGVEGWFSVLKAHIKDALALDRDEICDRSNMTDTDGNRLTVKERTMRFLERAARRSIKYITPAVVANMELHARDAVNAAEEMKDMVYGK
ncbi:unnamed protein product [Phytophthora fragariaefolia]|uniref:Unnamed protein product n=1 Tax=Phytophthora fragariaefolia TaxID=1490495 RepID=A0A9W6UFE9_9STRA|nr:unnamed protein product [Phytophthora fragariaefolia]